MPPSSFLQGVIEHLDYIQDMGFDAIWISPIIDNADGGYHGYWQRDMYAVNANFGTKSDLVQLSEALHARGMLLMVSRAMSSSSPEQRGGGGSGLRAP